MNNDNNTLLYPEYLDSPIFKLVGKAADNLGLDCYAVGGYVRDQLLNRHTNDIDFVTVGSGIELAKEVGRMLTPKRKPVVYANFGTAQLTIKGQVIEFVGARKESYNRDSRKPIVENGTLEDDQARRDFTINAMALCVNANRFGEFMDPFDGIYDLDHYTIKTPLDPDITFSDDPLRMMRAIRFASQLGFFIDSDTFDAIKRNANRIKIVSAERIIVELNKIMMSPKPSIGLELFDQTGLMEIIIPELSALKGVEVQDGIGHKENLSHTLQVVDNIAKKTDDLYLRWAALLHDIAKPKTKRFSKSNGWTFYNHNLVGARMVSKMFRRLKLPQDKHMKYVAKLVELHMRPSSLTDEGVTDSAIRRLLFDAGEDIDDLMVLVEADITSKNPKRVQKYLDNYQVVRQKLIEIEEKDQIRNFQPPISGDEIMVMFGLKPSKEVGILKECIKNAILDGKIHNDYQEAKTLLIEKAKELSLTITE